MERWKFITLAGAFMMLGSRINGARGAAMPVTILSAPLLVGGEWSGSSVNGAFAVISRMREACLTGISLVSDRQPAKLRVDDHSTGPPHIWLHEENPDTAWIVVNISERHWVQLAYQFGHELGHVLCNSWLPQAKLDPPCRWLEETMVEAFSIRGLGLLADSWERDPPFPHDAPYANAIRTYREHLIQKYRIGDGGEPVTNLATWFRANRLALDHAHGLGKIQGPAIIATLSEMEQDKGCVADMGAVNRWPALSALPITEYLRAWRSSCDQIGTPAILPTRLQTLLDVS